MIHIATVHWNTARWIDLQQSYLRQHLKSEFRIYAWLNNIPDAPADSFYYATREPVDSHALKLNLLADIICASSASADDILIFMDGDAFPVGNLETLIHAKLPAAKLVAVQRLENNRDLQPHPCFCATTVGFWREIKGDWKAGHCWKNVHGDEVTDVGGNLLKALDERGVKWVPLLRSNKRNPHPVFFGIYGDVIYHHGAGFRNAETRIDMTSLQFKTGDRVLAKIVPGFGRRIRRKAFKKVVAANDQLSEQVFETIRANPQFYTQFI